MKSVSIHLLNAQRKRTRRVQAKLDRCERKLAHARDKLNAANRELKVLRKLKPKSKIIDGTFSVVSPIQMIEHKQ